MHFFSSKKKPVKTKEKKESLSLALILKKIAPRIGATVLIEPEREVSGQITFKSGKRSYFRYNTLNLNPVGSSAISRDKDYSNFFMKKMGYPTISGKTFVSDKRIKTSGEVHRNIDAAYKYAKKLNFPVIVKPNSGSQGTGVSLVYNKKEFYKCVHAIFKHDHLVLVQKHVQGKDYRIVVLDKKIISAYERIPLNVVGKGISTIKQLLDKKQKLFTASSRDTKIKINDPRILAKLKHQKLNFKSILKKKQVVYLLDSANLSTGGESVDVTENVHPEFKKLAVKLTHDMGLRMCGVDIMIEGDISEQPKNYWVIEINASPGLDHYVKTGKEQEEIVENLYFEVLKHLET